IDGEHWLIQDKRNSSDDSNAHDEDYYRLLQNSGRRLLNIHTGRTGKKSRTIHTASPRLPINSRQRLLANHARLEVRHYLRGIF
ncbi:restriction endonuclease, partial [Klebsiella pneumoniae]|nr:restriction endonuclease [Klebsiella pneumoniae]